MENEYIREWNYWTIESLRPIFELSGWTLENILDNMFNDFPFLPEDSIVEVALMTAIAHYPWNVGSYWKMSFDEVAPYYYRMGMNPYNYLDTY